MSLRIAKYSFLSLILLSSLSFRSTKILEGYKIIVIKHEYMFQVFDQEGWYGNFPCVFGNKNLQDKMIEGDRETPEGDYKIISKRQHQKWNKMMLLDYPTPADVAKFEQRKQEGLISPNAKIGSGIAIHGTWPHEDYVIDQFQNWTDGCIALKNLTVDEVYDMIPVGTPVKILP